MANVAPGDKTYTKNVQNAEQAIAAASIVNSDGKIALRVVETGGTGSATETVKQASQGAGYAVFADTSFVSGDSPATHDVNTALGRNATMGYFYNYGAGDVTIAISENGTDYGTAFLVTAGSVVEFDYENIDSMKVTHSGTNTAYTSRFK